jgi:glycosyltransferase involved in cell wall biosynthesis
MKVCVPVELKHEGGGFYFLAVFTEFLAKRGIPVTDKTQDDFDVLFVNGWLVPYELILSVKKTKTSVRVVHRVDGSAQDYGRMDHADHWQASVNLLADATIFQSDYGRYATRSKYRVISQDGCVIHNPVDIAMFRPEGVRATLAGTIKVCNAAWSTNRMKGTWQIPGLAKQHPDVTFVLCGRYPDMPELPNVNQLGHLEYAELARVMRSCDAFLDLQENECFSNVTLQAMASGLPVLHKASGGTPEMVGDTGVLLAPDVSNLRPALDEALQKRDQLGRAARKRVEQFFSPDVVLPEYVRIMEGATRHPVPGKLRRLRLAMQGYPVFPYPWWQWPYRRLAGKVSHDG